MRSYLGVVLLAGYAVAVPATNQFVIGQAKGPGLDALVGTFDAHHSHAAVETHETIYTYLSQQDEYIFTPPRYATRLIADMFADIRS